MNPWFRMYHTVLDDPKVQRLPDRLFKAWVNMLCLASRYGGVLPGIEDVAFALRLTVTEAAKIVAYLTAATLLDKDGETFRIHKWEERQFQSDTSTQRVKRFRERHRKQDGSGDETSDATPPDTDSESETEKKEVEARVPRLPPKRGSRIPENFEPSPAGVEFATKLGLNPQNTLAKFRDHWTAATGQSASKLDWDAAWRTWCRKEVEFARNKPTAPAIRGSYAPPAPDDESRRLAGYAEMIKKRVPPGQKFTSADRFKLIKAGLVTMEDCEKAGCAA